MEEAPQYRVRQIHQLTDIAKDVCGGTFGGNLLAIYSKNIPYVYDFSQKTGFFPETLKPITSNITSIAISKCGEYVVSGHNNGELCVWAVARRKLVTRSVISNDTAITNITFLDSYSHLVVTCANQEMHRVEISSMLVFMFIKSVKLRQMDDNALSLSSICSKDSSVVLIAAGFQDHISILNSDLQELSRVNHPGAVFAFTNEDWHGYLAIVDETKKEFAMYKVCDNGQAFSIWTTEFEGASHILAISNSTFIAIHQNSMVLVSVHHGIVTTYSNIPYSSKFVCGGPGMLFSVPTTVIEIENVMERMAKLRRDERLLDAVETGVSCLMNELPGFSCVRRLEIQEEVQKILCELLPSANNETIRDIAESFVHAELFDVPRKDYFRELCEAVSSSEARLRLLLSMLQVDSIEPDYAERIVRKLADLAPVGDKTVEDTLMRCSFARSFVREALALGFTLQFSRFVVQLFWQAHQDILPPFALIVDTGMEARIRDASEFIFLHNHFSESAVNMCIVWLHAPNTNRLSRVIHACSDFSKDLADCFLSRTPIQFGAAQDLTSKDIVRSIFLCFQDMKPPENDGLFLSLADRAISDDIVVPSRSLPYIIPYIFESSSSFRSLREKLLLKIVDHDYAGRIDLQTMKMHCVKCGFSEAAKRLWCGSDELELQIQCFLRSERPEEAFDLLASEAVNAEYAQAVFPSMFPSLLHIDPQRTVVLVQNRFPKLHRAITSAHILSRQDIKLYFDTRFAMDPPMPGQDSAKDTKEYLLFMKDHMRYITDFMWNTKNINQIAVTTCQDEKLYIGLAILECRAEKYEEAFKWYQMHVNLQKGVPEMRLTETFLEHVKDIRTLPSIVYETVLSPFVIHQGSENVEHLRTIIERVMKEGHRTDILSTCYLLYSCCGNDNSAKQVLLGYLHEAEDLYIIGPVGTAPLDVSYIVKDKEKLYTASGVSVMGHASGVTIVTCGSAVQGDKMAPELAEKAQSLVQHAELGVMLTGRRIPEKTNALIIIDNALRSKEEPD